MGDSQLGQRPIWRRRRTGRAAGALAFAVSACAATALMAGLTAAPALADPGCAKFAAEPSKGGSDGNAGDLAHPYATLGKLLSSLSAGQTGCIFSGQTIDVNQPQSLRNQTHGTEAAPITITSTNPAEPATVTNSLALEEGSDWINFTHLRFWWAQPPPYTCWNAEGNATDKACNGEPENPEDRVQIAISSSHTSWLYDDIQNFNTDICMNIVSYAGSVAHETLIEHDQIHNCGLPFTGEKHVDEEAAWHDHAIYDYGIGTKIFNDYIYGNSRNGILFYGGGDGGVAEHNIIDENGNGITFGSTVDSTARWNIITNNSLDDGGHCAPRGCDDFGVAVNETSGARFEHNCLDNNLSGEIEFALSEPAGLPGLVLGGNLLKTNPMYADAASHDYTLSANSPCLGYGPDTAQPGGPPPTGAPPSNTALPGVLSSMPGASPIVGEAQIALTGGWSGAPTSFSYQWNACAGSLCTAISEATGPVYIPSAAYAGDTLSVTVTATNAHGSASATSPQTPPLLAGSEMVAGRPSGVLSDASPAFATQGASGGLVLSTLGPGAESLLSMLLGGGAWTATASPSAAVGPGGAIWIAFEGPGHSLWITGEVPGTNLAVLAYRGPAGTTYSEPSIAIDPADDIWVTAEGPQAELMITQRRAGANAWSSSPATDPGMVFSSPSAAADPSGNVWIAFQGQDHALSVTTDWPGGGGFWTSSVTVPGTTYSQPSTMVDPAGNVWVAAEGPGNALLVTERVASQYRWLWPRLVWSGTVYSAPSAAVGAGGNVSIAFQGPGRSLWVADESPYAARTSISYAGPEGMAASAPAEVVGPRGELWVGYEQTGNQLAVLERLPSGIWTPLSGG
jgi:hypothetical protein